MDNSLSIDDLVNEVYLRMIDKGDSYLYNKVKQTLIDIYRKKKSNFVYLDQARYCDLEEVRNRDIEEDCIICNELEYLKEQDKLVYTLVYSYFILNLNYREISEKYNIPVNTVKRKIDKGLEIIKNNI